VRRSKNEDAIRNEAAKPRNPVGRAVLEQRSVKSAKTGAYDVDCLAGEAVVGGVPPFDPLVPTIFHSEWWLNIVSDGGWEEARVATSGRPVGRFPFVVNRMPAGLALCGMPPLTHFLGPAIDDGTGAACNRALRRAQITRELLDQMPKTSGFYQKFSREVTDTLLFQERGFMTSVQFTYEIAPLPQVDLWRMMRDKTRNVIRRAEVLYEIETCFDPEAFTAAYNRHLEQRGLRNYYDTKILNRLCAMALAKGQGEISVVRSDSGDIAGGIFCVTDAVSTYYFLTTRDAGAGNGAVAMLLWHAIKQSAARGLIFDFDGIGVNGSRVFFTGFGGEVRPRYIASKHSPVHRLVGGIGNPFRRREQTTFY
jgi:hypothetical protein